MLQQLMTQFGKDAFGMEVPWTVHLYPLFAIVLYLCYPTSWRIPSSVLESFTLFHNAGLVGFSFATFVSLSYLLHRDGIVFEHTYYFGSGNQFDNVIYFFYLSKYYEFFDTFLLYLHGKKPIFLQKFHHVGAVLVWHLCYVYKVDAIWISTLVNSFVHTIMYFYYLGCFLGLNAVRRIKQYITTLQLVQLCVPSVVALWKYRPPVETPFNYGIIVFFVSYVAVLVYLFLEFYWRTYFLGSKPATKKAYGNSDVENWKQD